MGPAICTVILFLSLSAMAQLPVVPLQVFKSSAAITPASVGGIRYWWRFEDAGVTNSPVTNWLDRIVSLPLTNADNTVRPTNSNNGVGFNGSVWLTNTQPFAVLCGAAGCAVYTAPTYTNGSIFIIFSSHGTGTQGLVCNDNVGGEGLLTVATRQIEWFGAAGTIFGNYIVDAPQDVGLSLTNSGTVVGNFYTNGVLAVSIANKPTANAEKFVGAASNGSSGQFDFNGKILDIAYYTNYLTAAQWSTLHTYAQTRGVSP